MREAKIPTNVLWVDLPNTHKGNEEALRQAMVAHDVVTNIKDFLESRYAFLEFTTIEGASNAKNVLDGCLIYNTKIHLLSSCSCLDNLTTLVGFPRSEMYNDSPHVPRDYLCWPVTVVMEHHKGMILDVEGQDKWTMVQCQSLVVSFQHLKLAHLCCLDILLIMHLIREKPKG